MPGTGMSAGGSGLDDNVDAGGRGCCWGCCPAHPSRRHRQHRVLPVTLTPLDCDYLEIRPQRRIRVIRRLAAQGQDQGYSMPDGPVPGPRAPRRSREDDEDEEYWFENAVPTRPPIQQPPPTSLALQNSSRIINKFEPQQPPRIPGIRPPASSASASTASGRGGGSAKSSASVSPTQHRLPRKVILPTSSYDIDLDDDDDDDVHELPSDDDEGEAKASGSDCSDEDPDVPPSMPMSPIVKRFVTDVPDMMLNIAADATAPVSTSSPSPPMTTTEERRSPVSFPKPAVASNSARGVKNVATVPDPAPEDTDVKAQNTTVVVTGGHLGGRANVAFEGGEEEEEEEIVQIVENPSTSPHGSEKVQGSFSTSSESVNETDVGYIRHRDLAEVMTAKLPPVAVDVTDGDKESYPQPDNLDCETTTPSHSKQNFVPNATPAAAAAATPNNHIQDVPKPILFFIHSVGGSANTWNTQIDFFSALGYDVIVPDLLGHGFSSVPDNAKCYTFTKLFHDLLTIFDHYVGDARPCALVGHAYGCSFATALAKTRPNSVIMLLLLSGGGPTPLAPPPPPTTATMTTVNKILPKSLLWGCLKPFLRCRMVKQQQYNPKGRQLKFQETFDLPAYVFKHVMAGQSWPEGDAAFHRRLSLPTLLVYGLKDPFVSLVEMCEMERVMPKAYLELLPLAGHMVMHEQPKQLNLMMRAFIEKYSNKHKQQKQKAASREK